MLSAMTPKTATAITPATRATVLFTPEATPTSCSSTAPMTALVSGATVIPMPSPITHIAGKKVVQYEPPAPGSASSRKPTAATSGPATSGARAPRRSARLPAGRESPPSSAPERFGQVPRRPRERAEQRGEGQVGRAGRGGGVAVDPHEVEGQHEEGAP